MNGKRFPLRSLMLPAALIGLLILPQFLKPYLLDVMIVIFLFAFLGAAWDLIGGYAGQLSLGHAAFFGIGAYTSTYLFVNFQITPWIGMLAGGLLATLIAAFIGFLCFRYGLRGPFFALATLAFAEVLRLIATNWTVIGGSLGILIPLQKSSLVTLTFTHKANYYFIILFMMLLGIGITYLIDRSKMGLYLMAIREDEDAAESAGVNTTRYKLWAISISAFLTAMAGTFYAQYIMYISPEEVFGIHFSIEMILRPIIGGSGTVLGPVIGAFVLGPLSELARVYLGGYSGVHLMIYGLIVILVVLFLPDGIGPRLKELFKTSKDGSHVQSSSTAN
jgi:branched-chain amino acid transport system permease protein